MRIDRGATVFLTLWLILMGFLFIITFVLIMFILLGSFFSGYHYPLARNMTSPAQRLSISLSPGFEFMAGSVIIQEDRTNIEQQMQVEFSNHGRTINQATIHVINGSMISGQRRRIADTMVIFYELHFNKICSSKVCQDKIKHFAQILFRRMTLNMKCIVTNRPSATSPTDRVIVDIDVISEYWSKFRPYHDNPTDTFGILNSDLPAGCQIEQIHILHRHASKYPSDTEADMIKTFAHKIMGATKTFTGPLAFLNTWSLRLRTDNLVSIGKSESYASGAQFWTNYGQHLFDVTLRPLLRSNTLTSVRETTRGWAAGFFGFDDTDQQYTLLEMPTTQQNNTLYSIHSCRNFADRLHHLRDFENILTDLPPLFLTNATHRLSHYAPSEGILNVSDTFTMQLLCTYEYIALGSSHFCSLFTIDEWKGFEYTYDLYMYNGFGFGQTAGRALGLGYLEELLARLTNQQIHVSSSSVNATLDSSPLTFPLNQKIYFDASDDSTIISFLTALSFDYFHENLTMKFPTRIDRRFRLTRLTPYAARLITEKITCKSRKFIRMKLNNGILPLTMLQNNRSDGLYPLDHFLTSQINASSLANYQSICFRSSLR